MKYAGLPSKGGESQNDDEVVPDANPASVIDVDDFVDDEDDDDLHSHFEDEQDTQILCVKHFGSSASKCNKLYYWNSIVWMTELKVFS